MVESIGLANELDSPFYLENELICKTFETFISSLGGEVNGKYNAWSYHVIGRIKRRHEWIFQIKKATYSSGNLILSSASQNLHLAAIWKCKNLQSAQPDFQIHERRRFDWIKKLVNKNIRNFSSYPQFVIQSKTDNHPIVDPLIEVLSELFKHHEVFSISYKKCELIIELRTDKLNEPLIEKLINLQFETH